MTSSFEPRAGGRTTAGAIFLGLSFVLGLSAGCKRSPAPTPAPPPVATTPATEPTPEPTPEPAPEPTPLPSGIAPILQQYKGDLDGMVKRRLIRVLTVQSPIFYFVDRGREVGLTYETIEAFEKSLNTRLGNRVITVHVIAIPVPRSELIPRLLAGEGDIAAAALTVTRDRKTRVDFSAPFATGVKEVLVTGPSAPPVADLNDLSGKEVYVRASSAYAEHLGVLNARFKKEGRAPVKILKADEVLEDGDILEMVNAGLVPATVVDSYMAELYTQVFPNISVHADISSPPMQIAWAFRKGSPKLKQSLDAFVKSSKQGTLSGNVLINRYLKTNKWVKNARSDEDRHRFESMVSLFQKYGKQYDLDYLLMVAQGYQESGLDQTKKSGAGAIGVMQVLPSTARDKAVNIPNIDQVEDNIHAGVKYIRWVIDNYYKDPGITPVNRALFAFASYNAGPAKVNALRREAKAQGLNPDRWFSNVELVAARRIGRETVTYVANIYKYYLAYQLVEHRTEERQQAKATVSKKAR